MGLTKVCRVCGRRVPLEGLVKSKNTGFGRASICKPCYNAERKRYPSYGTWYERKEGDAR